MQFVLIACFFLLCLGHHHPRQSAVQAPSCKLTVQAFDDYASSWQSGYGTAIKRDEFVTRYPANEQHRVLVCLDKNGRGTVK